MKERLSSLLKSSLALVQFTHMFCGGALYSSNTPNTVLQPGSSSAASDYIWRVFKIFNMGNIEGFLLVGHCAAGQQDMASPPPRTNYCPWEAERPGRGCVHEGGDLALVIT